MDAARIDEIEARTRHDVIAFLTNLEESIGADSRHVHIGMTSSDVLDTALALQLQLACEVLLGDLERFRGALRTLALRHKGTLCVGRSHGVHAEPMVFGLKPALWYAEAGRNIERLNRAKEAVRVGKISGAIGTFAHVDPDVEEEVCRLLGLEPDLVVTAEDARSYKPARGHWRHFEERTGAGKHDTVHVAASLYHDIRPTTAWGYRNVWIARRIEALRGADPTRILPDLTKLPDTIEELARA